MLFNSFHFLIFFMIVSIFYYCIPHRIRWVLLLVASYYFYMCWKPALILLIIFSTFSNYILALCIAREKIELKRKRYLQLSLLINFGLLFLFKYSVFLNESIIASINWVIQSVSGFQGIVNAPTYTGWEFDIILPMGISFYTFQAASYTVDVYKKKIKPVRHYGIFSLFITFFPQLVAGPIERSKNLLPQFFQKHKFDKERVLQGCKLMLLGYFKKIVIADRVAVAVNTIYNAPTEYSGLSFVIATLFFTFQIYCDFSGYSDIAMGSARVLGFDLMMNFDKPYLSKSIREFWHRWHISLSTWFMDYVYIPLGGNRKGRLFQYRNLMATFLISGLWHGANWTFVVWGGLHGIYQIFGIITKEIRQRFQAVFHLRNTWLAGFISMWITFCLVAIGWIFFRANTIGDAFYILHHLLDNMELWTQKQYLYEVISGLGINLFELVVVCSAILFLMLTEVMSGNLSVFHYFEKRPYLIRLVFYTIVCVVVLTAGVYYNAGEFIYFQF